MPLLSPYLDVNLAALQELSTIDPEAHRQFLRLMAIEHHQWPVREWQEKYGDRYGIDARSLRIGLELAIKKEIKAEEESAAINADPRNAERVRMLTRFVASGDHAIAVLLRERFGVDAFAFRNQILTECAVEDARSAQDRLHQLSPQQLGPTDRTRGRRKVSLGQIMARLEKVDRLIRRRRKKMRRA
jgi:hypothetical protein